MMDQGQTFRRYPESRATTQPACRAVFDAVDARARASIEIADLTRCGALAGITGRAQHEHVGRVAATTGQRP